MSLQKYAIISGNKVVNIIEYETQPTQPIPGLDPSHIAIQTDIAGPGWTSAVPSACPATPDQCG